MVADEMMTFLGRRFLEKGSLWLFQASMAGMTELRLAPLATRKLDLGTQVSARA